MNLVFFSSICFCKRQLHNRMFPFKLSYLNCNQYLELPVWFSALIKVCHFASSWCRFATVVYRVNCFSLDRRPSVSTQEMELIEISLLINSDDTCIVQSLVYTLCGKDKQNKSYFSFLQCKCSIIVLILTLLKLNFNHKKK